MSKQPKLSVATADLPDAIKQSLAIPENAIASKVVIGLVGDEYTSRDGRHTFVPVTLFQNRKDVTVGSQVVTDANKFFRGWDYNTVLRCTENVDKNIYDKMKFKEGVIIEGANLAVDYSLTPFYDDQEGVLNPRTGEYLQSGGEPIYRNVRFGFGEVEHTGLDIPRDSSELEEVADSYSLENEEATF